ncbi:MAG TPA: diaminopropionate ammonia-lyase [Solirubrobacteraceae bacterium]
MPTLLRDRPGGGGAIEAPPREPLAFHRALDGYQPTPLVGLPELASELGVRHLDVKLEIDRLGLPSFKVMGAAWGTIEALRDVLPPSWTPDQGLGGLAGALPALTLVAATEGNHGRAVARIAGLLGLRARILVPDDVADARVAPIVAEGAEVVRVAGSYDDAVARSAAEAQGDGRVLVSDTSWPGYERVPAAVVDGYSTILWEVEEQLAASGRGLPDLVLVQLGVGSFGAAVIRHVRQPGPQAPRIVGVEPEQAACVLASLAADRRLTIPGPHHTVMAGLNCGTPSLVAWPLLREGLDGVVALDDDAALEGVRTLAEHGVAVGECSGVAVAAARELLTGPQAASHRERLGLWSESSVLLFATEGVTS